MQEFFFLRQHITQMKKAVEIAGVDLMRYMPWGCKIPFYFSEKLKQLPNGNYATFLCLLYVFSAGS